VNAESTQTARRLLLEIGPQRTHARRDPAELFEVSAAQLTEAAPAERGEPEPDDPMVADVDVPVD
jgi:hypothetical protein